MNDPLRSQRAAPPQMPLPVFAPDAAGTEDDLDDALALVTRVNERVRQSAETLTPTGVPRVA